MEGNTLTYGLLNALSGYMAQKKEQEQMQSLADLLSNRVMPSGQDDTSLSKIQAHSLPGITMPSPERLNRGYTPIKTEFGERYIPRGIVAPEGAIKTPIMREQTLQDKLPLIANLSPEMQKLFISQYANNLFRKPDTSISRIEEIKRHNLATEKKVGEKILSGNKNKAIGNLPIIEAKVTQALASQVEGGKMTEAEALQKITDLTDVSEQYKPIMQKFILDVRGKPKRSF